VVRKFGDVFDLLFPPPPGGVRVGAPSFPSDLRKVSQDLIDHFIRPLEDFSVPEAGHSKSLLLQV
jgi:hypothetical protein